MQLFGLLWLLFLCSLIPLSGQTHFSFSGENVPVSKVFEVFQKKYGIQFGYSSELLNGIVATAEFSDKSIEEALNLLLFNQPVEYLIIGDQRVLLRGQASQETLNSQDKNVEIQGIILDQKDLLPISDVALHIPGTNYGTFTADDGSFQLRIPNELASGILWCEHLAYRDIKYSIPWFKNGNNTVHLVPISYSIDEISIVETKRIISNQNIEARLQITPQAFNHILNSPSGEDILRSTQLIAGVSADDDLSSEVKIRGSQPDETLIVLDGIPIYNSGHFYGIFSAINSIYVDELNVYKNALPLNFGGKTGGMVELQSSNAIPDKINGIADINLLSSSIFLDIPAGNRSALRFSGRSTITDLSDSKFFSFGNQTSNLDNIDPSIQNFITRKILKNTNPDFSFSDWNLKFMSHPSHKETISLNAYFSNDDFINGYEKEFRNQNLSEEVSNVEFYNNQELWNNMGFSMNYGLEMNENINLTGSAYYTHSTNSGIIESNLKRERQNGTVEFAFKNRQENEITDYGINLMSSIQLSTSLEFSSGVNAQVHHAIFSFMEDEAPILDGDSKAFLISPYAELEKILNHHTTIRLGLRTSYFQNTQEIYISPRIYLNHQLQNNFSLKASYSHQYQFLREFIHENRLGQIFDYWILADDETFPVSSVHNYMVGSQFASGKFTFDLELYHKDVSGVLEHAQLKTGFNSVNPAQSREYQLFVGDGKMQGMDLSAGFQQNNFYSQIAYTLSKSTNSFKQIAKGSLFPAQDDRRHQFKWINQLKIGNLGFSLSNIYSSGKPYSDLSSIQQIIDRTELSSEQRIRRLPHYNRMDIGIDYTTEISNKFKATFGASVFNVLNRQNVKYLQYIYSLPTTSQSGSNMINTVIGTETNLLDRTLNLNLKVEF